MDLLWEGMNSVYALPFAYFVVLSLKEDKTACYDHIVYFLLWSKLFCDIGTNFCRLGFPDIYVGSKYI